MRTLHRAFHLGRCPRSFSAGRSVSTQRNMQRWSIFGDIDWLASKHLVNLQTYATFVCSV